ncbi:uncharacterized protein LOC124815889 isoform X1 [Hydra vulgaris]|uniref:uncharacterized protein LOC124815889 isoform X1 n=1 Tax=Hydra vulgaris TaxID=6087 RepID=UPI001F5F921E|nr:uncharacterized protein LOC124815889 isoform X1 [Hydra vulgaris]XP_047140689.1 uncharacterized protein LOC124815889 isoform X1 [Hydra vulgaris]
MFICYICGASLKPLSFFQNHLQRHNSIGEIVYPIKCLQNGCKCTFTAFMSLVRHIKCYHNIDNDFIDENPEPKSTMCNPLNDNHNDLLPSFSEYSLPSFPVSSTYQVDTYHEKTLEYIGSSLVSSLRANSSVPYYIIPEIIASVNNISQSLVSYIGNAALSVLDDIGANDSTRTLFKSKLESSLIHCNEPLKFLDTLYKQDKHLEKNSLFVTPETCNMGPPRYETNEGISKIVYDTFQYISVEQTLKSLLHNPQYIDALNFNKQKKGIIKNFSDGQACKNHELFSDYSKISLKLQLFYDGMGTSNPLRGQPSLCSIGVFYFAVLNLPVKYNSCFTNVHLVALCYSHDIKVYGFDAILEKFSFEMNKLSEIGISGEFPIIGRNVVYASLAQVACDNLALNSIFGFIESFSGSHFCTLCYATSNDIQIYFTEDKFEMRTIQKYEIDVGNVQSGNVGNKNHCKGVKKACVLNSIKGFYVTSNFSLDIMHTVLEGVVVIELGAVLYCLSVEKRFFTLGELNNRLSHFWSMVNVDKKNKLLELNKLEVPGHGLSPSMKAMQIWSLLLYLPLIVCDFVPEKDEHWKFLLELSTLVDLIFAPKFTTGMVTYLKYIIASHLENFKFFFGNHTRLRPKHHFLVHLPTIIMNSGPLIGMNCLKYELKNSFFKRSAHIVSNFKNICFTLAKRHQHNALHHRLSSAYMRNLIISESHDVVPICSLHYSQVLLDTFHSKPTDDIFVAFKIKRGSLQYKTNHHLTISEDEDYPVFGKVISFVSIRDESSWFVVLSKLNTLKFVEHCHCFLVEDVKPVTYLVINLDELIDDHPVLSYQKENAYYKRQQYHVFKE